MKDGNEKEKVTKKIFLKKGTCSHAFYYLLNRESGFDQKEYLIASDVLAGGILRQGYQCGMAWGSSLAVGSMVSLQKEQFSDPVAAVIEGSRKLLDSFYKQKNTYDCADITDTDWNSKLSMAKYALTGKFMTCFSLFEDWAPEAIEIFQIIQKTAGVEDKKSNGKTMCCASEVIKRMGGSEKEALIVAGFSGGIGLSGGGCGALAAGVWYKSLQVYSSNGNAPGLRNPEADKVLNRFLKQSDYQFNCSEITGRKFNDVSDHSNFVQSGGCRKLIESIVSEVVKG